MNKETLIKEIEHTFKKVTLEDGIGIFEADELDACSDEKRLKKARNKDRSFWRNWKDIEEKHIKHYSSVMCFMDSQGIRFTLPAYMVSALRNDADSCFSADTTIYAIERGAVGTDKKDLYTLEQKQVIAKFLKYMIEDAQDEDIDTDVAQRALDNEWAQYL